MRTGDFAIGADINRLEAGKEAKIWMAPLHDPAEHRNALLVRAARLTGMPSPAPSDTVRSVNLGYGYSGGAPNPGAFFPSRVFTLPQAGEWLVVATSGPDWACVILSVR